MGYKANITSNLVNQLIRIVLGALTSILVARVLGPAGQGYAAYVLIIFTLIGDNGHFGLNNAVMYFKKRSAYDTQQLFNVNVTALGLLFLLISAAVLLIRSTGLALTGYNYLFIFGGLILVLSDLLFTNHHAWLTGDERIVENNRYNIIVFLIKSAAILLLWLLKLLTPFSFFAATVLAMLLNAWFLQSRVRQSYHPALDLGLLKAEFGYGSLIWLAAIFSFLLYRVDQLMIKQMLGVSELGVYSVAVTLAELMFLIPLSINSALLGKLYNTADPQASRKLMIQTFKLSCYVCAALAALGIPLSLLIPLFYGTAYTGAVNCTMILLAGVVFGALANVSAQYFFTLGKPVYHLVGSLATLLLNIGLNLLLIPVYGIAGAALASSLAYLAFGAFYIALFIFREGFRPRELFLLKPAELLELWRVR